MSATTPENKEHDEARAAFDRDGYAIFRQALDKELIDEASAHVSWLMARHPELRPEQLHHELVIDDPFWIRLIADDRLLDIAARFIGPNIALFASHYICKPPGDGQPVLWHQDGSYWPLEPMDVVTLWLAVDDSDPENGCMRVIPGTQHLDLKGVERRDDVASVLSSAIADGFVDESKAVDVVLKAGDVSVHHPNLIHGSEPNHSHRRRAGLTIRYIPTTTRILRFGVPILLRGAAVDGVNEYLPRPTFDPERHFPFQGA